MYLSLVFIMLILDITGYFWATTPLQNWMNMIEMSENTYLTMV